MYDDPTFTDDFSTDPGYDLPWVDPGYDPTDGMFGDNGMFGPHWADSFSLDGWGDY